MDRKLIKYRQMVVFVEGNVCSRLDHRSGQKNCIFARDADPLLTGKKPGNKTRKEERTREATIILKELLLKSNVRQQDEYKKTKHFTHLCHLHKRGSIIHNFW